MQSKLPGGKLIFSSSIFDYYYYSIFFPHIIPGIAAIGSFSFSRFLAMTHSVVSIICTTDEAFSKVKRYIFSGNHCSKPGLFLNYQLPPSYKKGGFNFEYVNSIIQVIGDDLILNCFQCFCFNQRACCIINI